MEKVVAAKQWQHHRQNGNSCNSKFAEKTAATDKRKQQSTRGNGDGSDSDST